MTYSYGANDKEVKVAYMGVDTLKGESGFKLQFANGHILYVVPKGLSLKIVDSEGKYSKSFQWKYEGPVEVRGTFCDVCAEDEKAAMKLIKRYFMR